MQRVDVAIIGAGILGLATAYQLLHRDPRTSVVLFEKESSIAEHQTGRNSGVIHSGIYYTPGSLKAENCRDGKRALETFCELHDVPFEQCGKVIVATNEEEVPTLHQIYENGQANGVDCTLIGPDRLNEIEPYVRGVRAIHVPETGIVDYARVSEALAAWILQHGGQIWTDSPVRDLTEGESSVVVSSDERSVAAGRVINCAGLYSDRIASMSGVNPGVQIVPFRGEYYELIPEARTFCRGLIYPVPDPSFPFLGVHFTRTIDGGVECGPNAVLSFAREGYQKTDVNLRELAETLTYSGFLRLASQYWKTGLGELWRSASKKAFVRALQKLVPEIQPEHLLPAPAGVRAQAVTPDGGLVDDFLIRESSRVINVCNAPSPAATSSLSIGASIAERVGEPASQTVPS